MTEIAVLGTGIMGAPMVRNLLAAGFGVRVWNRTTEKATPLADDGATVADSPGEAASGADLLLTMLADADTVAEAASGGAIDSLSEGAVWIQTSTVGIEGNERLAHLAADRGVTYVDAPVLGTKEPAEQGQLVVLASGPDEAEERCAPVFDAIGAKYTWLGEAGAGSRLKLVVNNWITGLLGLLGETISLARATGVDPRSFLDTIQGGPLDAPYAQTKGGMMLQGEYPPSFTAELARKDVGLVMDAARSGGLDPAIAEAVARYFDGAIESGHGGEDMAAVVEGIARN
jgi:3-hydroxyisobutyrate dehydrogenase